MNRVGGATLVLGIIVAGGSLATDSLGPRPHVAVRGIYGGVPQEILDSGRSLQEFGVNAVWLGSGSFTPDRMALLRAQGVQVYAEFNTLHVARYLEDHPDAAPIGPDGEVSPPPDGWQGICPTHEAYRKSRMEAFRRLLQDFAVDGVWLDYHHGHASWEQAEPNLPDTCFCNRCLRRFRGGDRDEAPAGPHLGNRRGPPLDPPGDVGPLAVRRLHRLGPRVPRDRRRDPALGAPRHLPQPLERRGPRRRPDREAGHRPRGPGRLPGRLQPHALSRPLRARR